MDQGDSQSGRKKWEGIYFLASTCACRVVMGRGGGSEEAGNLKDVTSF